jgi:hypothetical protein
MKHNLELRLIRNELYGGINERTERVVAAAKQCGGMDINYQTQSRRWIELRCLQRINSY